MDWRDTNWRNGTEIQKKHQNSLEDIKYFLQNNKNLLQKIIKQNEEKNNLLLEMSSQNKENNELLRVILKQNALHFSIQHNYLFKMPTAKHYIKLSLVYEDLKKKYNLKINPNE